MRRGLLLRPSASRIGAALVVAAATMLARPGEAAMPVPAVPHSLTAGERVVLSWDALPDRADEFEILLSVDGGGAVAIRATPSLDPETRSIDWTVPNLPAPAARLRIRWGTRGRETESGWSEVFEIRQERNGPLPPTHREGGEIALGGEPGSPLETPSETGPGPVISAAIPGLALALRSVPDVPAPTRALLAAVAPPKPCDAPALPAHASRRPSLPLRL